MEENIRIFCIMLAASAALAATIRLALPRILAWRGVTLVWHTRFGPALVFDSADEDGTTSRAMLQALV